MKKTYKEIYDYLKEKEFYYEEMSEILPGVFDISVDGDWKHEHGYLRYLMEEIGYIQIGEEEIGESDSDWYYSKHRFAEKEFAESMFKMFAPVSTEKKLNNGVLGVL